MKTLTLCLGILLQLTLFGQSTKGGIINFSFNGYTNGTTTSVASDVPDADINFIGETSTQVGDSLLSNLLLTLTETVLNEKLLGYAVIPVTRVRQTNVPAEMNGSLMIMNTITEKKAIKELNYDEMVSVNCRITQSGVKTKKGSRYYTPTISLTIKLTGNDGKTKWKKSESIKFKEVQVAGSLIEVDNNPTTKMDLSLKSLKSATLSSTSANALKGVSATELLDWYKQALDNIVLQ